jgi:hypothetical protein
VIKELGEAAFDFVFEDSELLAKVTEGIDPVTCKQLFIGISGRLVTSEGKFLVMDQPLSKLITFYYTIRRELFSRNFLVTASSLLIRFEFVVKLYIKLLTNSYQK